MNGINSVHCRCSFMSSLYCGGIKIQGGLLLTTSGQFNCFSCSSPTSLHREESSPNTYEGCEGFTKLTSKCVHPPKGTVFEGLPNKRLLALPAALSCQSAEHHSHHHAAMGQIHFDITAFHFSFVLHARSKKQLRVKPSPPSSAHTQANPNKHTQGTERKGEAKQKHGES